MHHREEFLVVPGNHKQVRLAPLLAEQLKLVLSLFYSLSQLHCCPAETLQVVTGAIVI